jgi:quercetin dioxygenase-like cupin family protein
VTTGAPGRGAGGVLRRLIARLSGSAAGGSPEAVPPRPPQSSPEIQDARPMPLLPPARDWDDAFANMAHVANSHELPGFWSARAAEYRAAMQAAGHRLDLDIAYGAHPRETYDIVWPQGTPRGLAVFVHGGYWMRLDKSYWTDFAEGARARGWAVCLPSYTLTPEARISQITGQIARVIAHAAARVDGPIRLSGHSAGGHLVTRMVCADSPLEKGVRNRIEHTLSISGLHDLRPLLHTGMNDTLHLDLAEARAESSVLGEPGLAAPLTCWVGGGERPEFIRQTKLLADIWGGLDVPARAHVDGEHNHFTVLEALKDPASPITDAFVGFPAGAAGARKTERRKTAMEPGIVKSRESLDQIRWNILGQTYVPKQMTEECFSWHASLPPGTFVPPHIHPDQDEFLYILEGRFTFLLDGQEVIGEPGDLVKLPRGVPHGIFNKSESTIKTLFWVTPTLQLYDLFWALHNMGPGADPAEIVAVSAAHAIDFLPPEDSGAGQ